MDIFDYICSILHIFVVSPCVHYLHDWHTLQSLCLCFCMFAGYMSNWAWMSLCLSLYIECTNFHVICFLLPIYKIKWCLCKGTFVWTDSWYVYRTTKGRGGWSICCNRPRYLLILQKETNLHQRRNQEEGNIVYAILHVLWLIHVWKENADRNCLLKGSGFCHGCLPFITMFLIGAFKLNHLL